MRLISSNKTPLAVVDRLPFECDDDDTLKLDFRSTDVEAIVRWCREVGLGEESPLVVEVEEWEGEEVNEWWREPGEGGMEEKWRDDPIQAVGGCGWWTKVSDS
jgi:hypothetical protein